VASSIADENPLPLPTSRAERIRQAFVGLNQVALDAETQPLRIYVQETSSGDKMRLGVNEFSILLNHLPMASVCSESRSHAAKFCRSQVKFMHLIYNIDASEAPSDALPEIQEPIFAQPAAVMVTSGSGIYGDFPPQCGIDKAVKFDSAEHLVRVINRVFGNCTQQIILDPWYLAMHTLQGIYWPHGEQTRAHEDWCVSDLNSAPSSANCR
jgi:hypothetical protein